ncbi:MAG: hypothetical protein ABEI80_00810 [Haloplanus sp.]
MTLDDVRAAAIDRALVGDDPETALALAGAADTAASDGADHPLAAVMLAVGCLAVDRRRPLDGRAWRPGDDPDPLTLVGAALAVDSRDVSLDRAAELADCAPATLDAVVERRCREKGVETSRRG